MLKFIKKLLGLKEEETTDEVVKNEVVKNEVVKNEVVKNEVEAVVTDVSKDKKLSKVKTIIARKSKKGNSVIEETNETPVTKGRGRPRKVK